MKTLVSRVWQLLQSRTLALVLLAVLIFSVILARLFNLSWISSSWAFLALITLLGINTLVCSVSRVGTLLGRPYRKQEILNFSPTEGVKNRAAVQTELALSEVAPAVTAVLRRSGYRVAVSSGNGRTNFFSEKGKAGEWGSIAFHLGLIVVLLGVLYSRLGRFEGLMTITEGQTITEQHQDYLAVLRVPPLGESHQGFQVRLDKLQPTYFEGKIGIDYSADITLLEHGIAVRKTTLKVNQPLAYRNTIFLLERYGFAPHFVLKDTAGKELFSSFVNLRVLEETSEDSFTIPGSGLTAVVKFYPDLKIIEGQPQTQSLLLNNPAMFLLIKDGTGEHFSGLVSTGEPAKFNDLSLSFTEVRYWTQYRVIQDTAGQTIIFAGFWLGIAGMLLRALLVEKRLWITAESRDGRVNLFIGGAARQFDSLYTEEFTRIVRGIEREIKHGPG